MALKTSVLHAVVVAMAATAMTANSSDAHARGPGPKPNADYHFLWAPARSNQTTCEPSTFSPTSSSNSTPPRPAADWRSCAALFSSWTGHNGTFLIHDDYGQVLIPILRSDDDCVLGVRAADEGHGFYTVGDGDVKGILRTALLNYSEGTDLRVQGDVNCTLISGGRAVLHWEIYGDEPNQE